MTPVPDRTTFEDIYAGQPRWEIGRPQKAIIDVAERISGSVLDAGCGTGENALYFASRGCKVMGIDFLAKPITRAKKKTAERGVTATFLVMDAIESIEPSRYEDRPDLKDISFSEGGPKAWFSIIKRHG